MADVDIAAPGVDRVAARRKLQFLDRLAEWAVGVACMGSQLYQQGRADQVHQEHRERDVLDPVRVGRQPPRRREEDGVVQRVEHLRTSDSLSLNGWPTAEPKQNACGRVRDWR